MSDNPEFDRKAAQITGIVERHARDLAESAGMNGSMHDGGAGALRDQIRFFDYGRHHMIPPEWAQYEKQLDPEYAEYQRLKNKFGGR